MSLHTFTLLIDDSEHHMDYETSLLPNVFPHTGITTVAHKVFSSSFDYICVDKVLTNN